MLAHGSYYRLDPMITSAVVVSTTTANTMASPITSVLLMALVLSPDLPMGHTTDDITLMFGQVAGIT